MTVHGPDTALKGMGRGGSADAEALEDIPNARYLQSVYSLAGAVDGAVVSWDSRPGSESSHGGLRQASECALPPSAGSSAPR
jgi:hypothetical protein